MVRYFMSVREACDLVLAAGSHAATADPGPGCVYVLNMGQPVRIVELAERMIRMSGYIPGQDIEVAFTGIREGERLQETLFAPGETTAEVGLEGVVAARPRFPSLVDLTKAINTLEQAILRGDYNASQQVLNATVPGYKRELIFAADVEIQGSQAITTARHP
jgi:O-antigen biosynthesis protein WbqV